MKAAHRSPLRPQTGQIPGVPRERAWSLGHQREPPPGSSPSPDTGNPIPTLFPSCSGLFGATQQSLPGSLDRCLPAMAERNRLCSARILVPTQMSLFPSPRDFKGGAEEDA